MELSALTSWCRWPATVEEASHAHPIQAAPEHDSVQISCQKRQPPCLPGLEDLVRAQAPAKRVEADKQLIEAMRVKILQKKNLWIKRDSLEAWSNCLGFALGNPYTTTWRPSHVAFSCQLLPIMFFHYACGCCFRPCSCVKLNQWIKHNQTTWGHSLCGITVFACCLPTRTCIASLGPYLSLQPCHVLDNGSGWTLQLLPTRRKYNWSLTLAGTFPNGSILGILLSGWFGSQHSHESSLRENTVKILSPQFSCEASLYAHWCTYLVPPCLPKA